MKLTINYQNGYWKPLDGIRGLAIFMVLIYHFRWGYFKPIMQLGWIGVDLFFVLSGFLITGILYDSKNDNHYYKNFISKRALRIFPLYYSVLIVYFTAVIIFKHHGHFNYDLHCIPYFITYTQNIYFAFHNWAMNDILNHFWSLAIEEQFYIVWPLLILLLNGKQIFRICIAGIILSIAIRNIYPIFPFAYLFTLARIDALLAGCLAAIMIRERKTILEKMIKPVLIMSLLVIIAIIGFTHNTLDSNIYLIRIGYTLFDIFFACMIVSLFDVTKFGLKAGKFFSSRAFLFLGKYSYGIYVYHRFIYIFLFKKIEKLLESIHFIPAVTIHIVGILIYTSIVLAISHASYHLFEKKFLDLKKYFVQTAIE